MVEGAQRQFEEYRDAIVPELHAEGDGRRVFPVQIESRRPGEGERPVAKEQFGGGLQQILDRRKAFRLDEIDHLEHIDRAQFIGHLFEIFLEDAGIFAVTWVEYTRQCNTLFCSRSGFLALRDWMKWTTSATAL